MKKRYSQHLKMHEESPHTQAVYQKPRRQAGGGEGSLPKASPGDEGDDTGEFRKEKE